VAVAGASFEVADGELVPWWDRRAWQSTLLRMVAGLESISSGTAEHRGAVVNELPARDRDNRDGVSELRAVSAHERLRQPGVWPAPARDGARAPGCQVRAAAATLELDALLDRKPRQLSGGSASVWRCGRALVRSPQVFLLDEPLLEPRRQAAPRHARGDRGVCTGACTPRCCT